jgi:hypothetical protein
MMFMATTMTFVVMAMVFKRWQWWFSPSYGKDFIFVYLWFWSSSSKVSSSSNHCEQLKCVLCYPLNLNVGLRRGIVTYRTTNEIFALWKCLETNHWEVWND